MGEIPLNMQSWKASALRLSPQWLCGNSCLQAHLASVRFKHSVCRGSLMSTYIRIPWSSYRKFARVGSEPTTTEFRSDTLTDWTIRPWVQLALRANFVQPLQFQCLFSVTFHFGYCLRQSPRLFWSKFFLR